MPKGLYARALLIIIAPMVILQSVVAFVFMERHWYLVTQRLSAGVVQDIAALIDILSLASADAGQAQIRRIAQEQLGLVVDFLPVNELPPPGPKPFFSLLDQALSDEISEADRPAVLDRYCRPLRAGRDPHQARQCGDARIRAPQRGLRLELPHLPGLDGRHLVWC